MDQNLKGLVTRGQALLLTHRAEDPQEEAQCSLVLFACIVLVPHVMSLKRQHLINVA